VKTNLRLKVVTDAERQMAAILNQLGLTPTAKDRAKPTNNHRGSLEVIRGSIADTHPELLRGEDIQRTEFRLPDLAELELEEGDKL